MKNIIQLVVIVLVLTLPVLLSAQPLPYDEGIGGGNGAPTGGGAPLGGGLLVLLALAIGYGTKRFVDCRKKIMD